MKRSIATSLLALLAGAGIGIFMHIGDPTSQHCPTEDSCRIDYRNGQWHIEKDVP